MKKEFKIDSSIYTKEAIDTSIIDFEDVASIDFLDWILSITWETDFEIEEIFNEFMNYCISVENNI